MTAKQIMAVILATASGTLCAADAKGGFAEAAGKYLASHNVEGVNDANALMQVIGAPCGDAAAVDATVEPRHKARKVRCWGTKMLPFFERWGLDVAEFDPDAAERGDLPDVIFITQAPHYSQDDVDIIFRTAAEGVHVVTLNATDQWSAAIAKRLGFKYNGVLTIGPPSAGGAFIPNCPKLTEGFPSKPKLDAEFGEIGKWLHGMYLTGDRCLMCVADSKQGKIATAVAQYPVGRGAVTLFGPRLYEKPDVPACKRMLLNLIDLLPPAPKALKMPFIYHPVPPEGKPYFELRAPDGRSGYLTEARPKDHIWHLGFFFSWKFINGRNFWEPHDKGAVNRVVSHSEMPEPNGATFESEISYELDGRAILRERRTVKAAVKPNGDYSFDWTGRFEALEDLAFTSSVPKWDKEKGHNNYNGYAGFSTRLAGNEHFSYAFSSPSRRCSTRRSGCRRARGATSTTC